MLISLQGLTNYLRCHSNKPSKRHKSHVTNLHKSSWFLQHEATRRDADFPGRDASPLQITPPPLPPPLPLLVPIYIPKWRKALQESKVSQMNTQHSQPTGVNSSSPTGIHNELRIKKLKSQADFQSNIPHKNLEKTLHNIDRHKQWGNETSVC